MKSYLAVCIISLFGLKIALAQTNDSLSVSQTSTTVLQAGDTLINLNKLNGGIVKFQITDENKSILSSNGLLFTDNAVLISENPLLLTSSLLVEIKTFASDNEWFINTIRIENKEKQIVIYASADKIEMATFWRKNGKIWVVIAVVAILFTVVIGYLFYLDRKISRIS